LTFFPDRHISSATLGDLEELERLKGRTSVESFLNNEFDNYLRSFFKNHGLEVIENIRVEYDPKDEKLEENQVGQGFAFDTHEIEGGSVIIGSEPENYNIDFDFLLTSTVGEEYLHCHYPYHVDIDNFGWKKFDQYAVDVISKVLGLYCEDHIENLQIRRQYISNIERDYTTAMAETTEELLKDFDNVDSNKRMMSHILNNPEPVFQRYNELRSQRG